MIIQRADQLPDLRRERDMILDFETTSNDPDRNSLNPYQPGVEILGVVAATREGESWYAPMRHRLGDGSWDPANLPVKSTLAWVQDQLNAEGRVVGHNIKYDLKCGKVAGLTWKRVPYDTVVVHRLIDEARGKGKYKLKTIAREMFGHDAAEEDEVRAWLKKRKSEDYGDVPLDLLARYAVADGYFTAELFRWCEANFPTNDLKLSALREMEYRLTDQLVEAEHRGIKLDMQRLMIDEYKQRLTALRASAKVTELSGMERNLDSNVDLTDLFLHQLSVEPYNYSVKTGQPSYDVDALTYYQNDKTLDAKVREIAGEVLKFRTAMHLAAFAESYRAHAIDDVLHCSFFQAGTVTGRMSCRDPNLQQVPVKVRSWFIARPGYKLLTCDYSQLEYRIFAHYTNDPRLIDAYRNDPKLDYHLWAAKLLGIPRRPAKNMNFGLLFGMGKDKLRRSMHTSENPLSVSQASGIVRTFYREMPSVRPLRSACEKVAKERGYVFDLYGYRRHLGRHEAYKAMNAVIQGSAAHLVKEKVLAANDALRERDAGLALVQVHDEGVFELRDDERLSATVDETIRVLQDVPGVQVPIYVNHELAGCWKK